MEFGVPAREVGEGGLGHATELGRPVPHLAPLDPKPTRELKPHDCLGERAGRLRSPICRAHIGSDPHLHTHLVLANAVEGPDGRWTAFARTRWVCRCGSPARLISC